MRKTAIIQFSCLILIILGTAPILAQNAPYQPKTRIQAYDIKAWNIVSPEGDTINVDSLAKIAKEGRGITDYEAFKLGLFLGAGVTAPFALVLGILIWPLMEKWRKRESQ